MKLSIVSPVYKAKTIIPELVHRIVESVSQITEDFEVILILFKKLMFSLCMMICNIQNVTGGIDICLKRLKARLK